MFVPSNTNRLTGTTGRESAGTPAQGLRVEVSSLCVLDSNICGEPINVT